MRFVTKRGASLSRRSKTGAMAAIFASEPEVTTAMREVNVMSDGRRSQHRGPQRCASGCQRPGGRR